mmetsp:Transcript_1104/g.3019  ORF Transcript_1104/g.3019 Transcript_1104/m.3019 type:complete len:374 (+) Transcript_1104:581-1702(+)
MHDAHRPAVGHLGVGVSGIEFAKAGRRMPLQLAHGPAGHQRVTVDTQEAVAPALLQVGERAVHHMALACRAQRHVLELGLEVQHFGHRHALEPAAVGDGDEVGVRRGRAIAGCGGLVGLHRRPLGQPLGRTRQCRLQPLTAYRLGEVVQRIELEGAQCMHGMRGDEHDQRHRLAGGDALAQAIGQLQAIGAGQLHIEQHHIATVLAQPGGRLRTRGGLRHHFAARFGDRLDQPAQPQPRQGFVVDDEDAQGGRHNGNSIRKANRVWLDSTSNWAATSCIKRRRCRTLRRARPWPWVRAGAPTLLTMRISTSEPWREVVTTSSPPSSFGSTPWRTAFSTSGCSSSGGRRAGSAAGSRCQTTRSRLPKRICSIAR